MVALHIKLIDSVHLDSAVLIVVFVCVLFLGFAVVVIGFLFYIFDLFSLNISLGAVASIVSITKIPIVLVLLLRYFISTLLFGRDYYLMQLCGFLFDMPP